MAVAGGGGELLGARDGSVPPCRRGHGDARDAEERRFPVPTACGLSELPRTELLNSSPELGVGLSWSLLSR